MIQVCVRFVVRSRIGYVLRPTRPSSRVFVYCVTTDSRNKSFRMFDREHMAEASRKKRKADDAKVDHVPKNSMMQMIPVALKTYMENGFPEHKSGDDICRFCGVWATTNSSVSDRYHDLYGCWKTTAPACDPDSAPGEEGSVCIPCCDECWNRFDIGDMDTVFVLGCEFVIETVHRAND
jgi:hypothetical protein